MILILSFLNVWLSLMCRKVRQGKARRRVSHYNTTFPAVFAIFETFVSMLSGIIIQCSSSSTSTLRRYPFIVIMVIWSFMLCYVGWGKIKCHSTRAHILMNRTSNELSVSASYRKRIWSNSHKLWRKTHIADFYFFYFCNSQILNLNKFT